MILHALNIEPESRLQLWIALELVRHWFLCLPCVNENIIIQSLIPRSDSVCAIVLGITNQALTGTAISKFSSMLHLQEVFADG
jgi:hypothetical protein